MLTSYNESIKKILENKWKKLETLKVCFYGIVCKVVKDWSHSYLTVRWFERYHVWNAQQATLSWIAITYSFIMS